MSLEIPPEDEEELRRRFELGPVLGKGGMGVVYQARQLSLDRSVAVKLLISMKETDRARFAREAQVLATLRHPGLVEVYDAGMAGSTPYLAMELMSAPTLEARLEEAPIPLEEALAILDAICVGLLHAHRSGFVHRDIKPGNIFVLPGGQVTVSDFGLARTLEAGQTVTEVGMVMGTPEYMAPELFLGEKFTFAADQYALALMGVMMVTGKSPHAGLELSRLVQATIRGVRIDLDPEGGVRMRRLEAVLRRAASKDPRHRFPDLEAMREALATVAGPESVPDTRAIPASPGTRPGSSRFRTAGVTKVTEVVGPPPTEPRGRAAAVLVLVGLALLASFPLVTRPGNLAAPAPTAPPSPTQAEMFQARTHEMDMLHEQYYLKWREREEKGLVFSNKVTAHALDDEFRRPLYKALNVGCEAIGLVAAGRDGQQWLTLLHSFSVIFSALLTMVHEYQNNDILHGDQKLSRQVDKEEIKMCKVATVIEKRLLALEHEKPELSKNPLYHIFRANLRLKMLLDLRHKHCLRKHDPVMTATHDELFRGLLGVARMLAEQPLEVRRQSGASLYRLRALMDGRRLFGGGRNVRELDVPDNLALGLARENLDYLDDVLRDPGGIGKTLTPAEHWFLVLGASRVLLDASLPGVTVADRERAGAVLFQALQRLEPEPGGLAAQVKLFPRKGENPDAEVEKLKAHFAAKGQKLPAGR